MNITRIHRKKCIIIFLTSLFIVTLFVILEYHYVLTPFYYFWYPNKSIYCYRLKSESLPDILDNEPQKGRSIFFHETSCNSYFHGKIFMSARQACAVESAARMNPNMDVYLLFTSPGKIQSQGKEEESDRIVQVLNSYKNVKIMHVDFEEYSKGSPVQNLFQKGIIDSSRYPQSHASDVLRYLTLWKYGGIYLDLDVIVIKTLEELVPNFAGSESEANVAAGVLSFAPSGLGHDLVQMCLEDLSNNFNGEEWGYNGPGVITRLLKRICGVKSAKDMVKETCQGFHVYPTSHFYAIPWWDWPMFFNDNLTETVLELTKNSHVIHVWNKHSINVKIPIESEVPYLLYAKKYCPKVIQQCDVVF